MNSDLTFRMMERADLADVVVNEINAYSHPWTLGVFSDCLEGNYECWVIEQQGKLLGHGVLSVAAGECHVLNVCVSPDMQSNGLGRSMVKHLLSQAIRKNAERVFLEVRASNLIAYKLYESLGFDEAGIRKGYYPAEDGREDAIVLSKELGKI